MTMKLIHINDGLYLDWQTEKSERKQRLFISKVATSAQLFQVDNIEFIPEKLLCRNDQNGSAYLVSCNSGELFLIWLYTLGICLYLTTSYDLIWANFIVVSDLPYLGTLDRSGQLMIGTLSSSKTGNSFIWLSKTLSVTPITCCFLEEFLVLSDGYDSCLCKVAVSNASLCISHKKLKYKGIISISSNEGKVILKTCDNRMYSKCISDLEGKITTKPEEGCLTLPELLKSMKVYSIAINKLQSETKELDKYMEQLAFAQCYFIDPVPFIDIDFQVEKFIGCNNKFMITVKLKIPNTSKLDARWWQLKIDIKNKKNITYIKKDLDSLMQIGRLEICVEVPFNLLSAVNQKLVLMEVWLTLSNFYTNAPVCCLRMVRKSFDILHFLTDSNIDHASFTSQNSFYDGIRKLTNNSLPEPPKMLSQVKQLVTVRGDYFHKNICLKFLTENVNSQLWYLGVPITICYKKCGDNIVIELKSCSISIILSVRQCIENRFLEEDYKGEPNIPNYILSQASLCQRIFDLERGKTLTMESCQKLYHMVSNLLSKIPIPY